MLAAAERQKNSYTLIMEEFAKHGDLHTLIRKAHQELNSVAEDTFDMTPRPTPGSSKLHEDDKQLQHQHHLDRQHEKQLQEQERLDAELSDKQQVRAQEMQQTQPGQQHNAAADNKAAKHGLKPVKDAAKVLEHAAEEKMVEGALGPAAKAAKRIMEPQLRMPGTDS